MLTIIQNRALAVAALLQSAGLTLATAESCTGGGLSYWLTSVPGSSAWFERGFVTYSNNAKRAMLGVNPAIINQFGAVSEQTVRAMAEGARQQAGTALAIAITGIAGPGGGLPDKPVGLVWFGLSGDTLSTQSRQQVFAGDREGVRLQAIAFAMELILDCVR